MRFVLRHADTVIANSDFTRQELLKMDVGAERIVLIHPGVDVERFRPGLPCDDLKRDIGLGVGEKLILSVGRSPAEKVSIWSFAACRILSAAASRYVMS